MGYTTYFEGEFKFDKPLKPEHKAYLEAFASTRRMKRSELRVAERPDPIRVAAGLPVGVDGGYFVGAEGFMGQEGAGFDAQEEKARLGIVNYNEPPMGQPGLWCQWVPKADGTAIVWDDGEKFYSYVEWLKYLIDHFLGPWGYKLNGEVEWSGEERDDRGLLIVRDNKITTKQARIVWEDSDEA